MVRIITFPPNWVKAEKAIAVTEATTVTEATSVTKATTVTEATTIIEATNQATTKELTTEIATATASTATTQATTEELATDMATTTANITKGSVVLPFGMDAESLIFVAAILLIIAAATIGFGLIVRQFHRLIRSSTGIQNMF